MRNFTFDFVWWRRAWRISERKTLWFAIVYEVNRSSPILRKLNVYWKEHNKKYKKETSFYVFHVKKHVGFSMKQTGTFFFYPVTWSVMWLKAGWRLNSFSNRTAKKKHLKKCKASSVSLLVMELLVKPASLFLTQQMPSLENIFRKSVISYEISWNQEPSLIITLLM